MDTPRNYILPRVDPLTTSDITQYGAVVAQNVYNGIDVVYSGSQQNLQFDFQVAPGADLAQIQLQYSGAQSVTLNDQGQIVLQTAGGNVYQNTPSFYQLDQSGQKQMVSGSYVQLDNGNIGIQATGYDPSKALVVDPVLSMGTYLGGSGNDYGYAVATDADNNVIIAGSTLSSNFPTTTGAFDTTFVGTRDVFISKLSAAGTALIFSTFISGHPTGDEQANAVAVDAGGNIYVTGTTTASDFYTTASTFDHTLSGGQDAFVLKLSSAGDNVIWSTLLGGTGVDKGQGIAVDSANQVYVVGYAEAGFPTFNAYQSSYGGAGDAFLSVIKADGSGMLASTYLGGSSADAAYGVALDNSGHIYVTGQTSSTAFPTTVGAYQTSNAGGQDGFVSRLTLPPTGTMTLDWSTDLGGSGTDALRGIAVDASNRAYVTGYTTSTNYPTSVGAYQTTLGGTQDAVVARIDNGALGFSTYVGGAGTDAGNAIALDDSNNVYVAGQTTGSFPTVNAAQGSYGGGANDAFVLSMPSTGASVNWSTYLGGSGDDYAQGIAVDTNGDVVVTGATAGADFPTASSVQGSNAGGYDSFVARYNNLQPPVLTTISPDTGYSATDFITTSTTLTLSGSAPASSTVTVYRADYGQVGTATASAGGTFTYNYSGPPLTAGTYAFTFTTTVSGATGVQSNPYLVTVDQTAPVVTLSVAASGYTLAPELRVVATDDVGLPATGTVTLDVDLNDDGDFLDPGEAGYMTAPLKNGLAIFDISPTLAVGTYNVEANVTDLAGNQGTSAISSFTINATGLASNTTTDATQQVDPINGNAQLQRGDLQISNALDWDQSPGTDVGLNPALVYNSDRVNNLPIVQATVQTDNSVALPATITAQLTWNGGTPQTAVNFSTTGMTPGDLLTVGQQVNTAVTTTGLYTYSLKVTMNYGTPVVKTITGSMFVIAEDSSAYGAGWTFAGVDRLISVTGGLLDEYGAGGYGFYASAGGGSYTSPAWDYGTLSSATGGGVTTYTYALPDGRTWLFNGAGYEVAAISADGLPVATYTYNLSNNLSKVQTPDGAVTTVAYSGGTGKLQTIQTGGRTATMTLSGNDLTVIQNPDGGLHTFAYAASTHKLITENFGVLSGTYAYSNGAETSFTQGDGGATSISPQALMGLDAEKGTGPDDNLGDP